MTRTKKTLHSLLKGTSILLCSTIFLTACGDNSSDSKAYKEQPANVLYRNAAKALQNERYNTAVKNFQEVSRQHPYSSLATKAQLMAAYTQYQQRNYSDAVIILKRFIDDHPGNKDIAYAYYLRALCYYEQIADVQRDQESTAKALRYFKEVVHLFPASPYARDAQLKIDLANSHLAGKNMAIARYYQKKHNYLAAINRYRRVVELYQTTSQVPEALYRLVESYLSLGLVTEARKTAAVLGHNYADSAWYKDAYELMGQYKSVGAGPQKYHPTTKGTVSPSQAKVPRSQGTDPKKVATKSLDESIKILPTLPGEAKPRIVRTNAPDKPEDDNIIPSTRQLP